ncbi:MAG: hypothetical protein K0S08_1944 [Gammaproteobacteria bacterium]|jgi:hypothetical protein|nr:hypothetical protein [Gammaproteobacteria bacterium]
MEHSNNKKDFKWEITQDKLVDILMHAATRDDIAKLDAKFEEKINKLDAKLDKLDAKYDKLLWFIIAGILIPIILHFIK